MVDVVNREYSVAPNKFKSRFGDYVDSWVSSVFFGANCVVVVKM